MLLLLTVLTHTLNPAPPCAATACYCLQAPEALALVGCKLTAGVYIYSFGIVMYEIISGQQAYHGLVSKGGL